MLSFITDEIPSKDEELYWREGLKCTNEKVYPWPMGCFRRQCVPLKCCWELYRQMLSIHEHNCFQCLNNIYFYGEMHRELVGIVLYPHTIPTDFKVSVFFETRTVKMSYG